MAFSENKDRLGINTLRNMDVMSENKTAQEASEGVRDPRGGNVCADSVKTPGKCEMMAEATGSRLLCFYPVFAAAGLKDQEERRGDAEVAGEGDGPVRDNAVTGICEHAFCNKGLDVVCAEAELALCKVPGYESGQGFALIVCERVQDALCASSFAEAVELFPRGAEGYCGGFIYHDGCEEYLPCSNVVPVVVCEVHDSELCKECLRACGYQCAGDAYYGSGAARFESLDDFKDCFHGRYDSTRMGANQG